jgi:hypothetical protein
MEKLLKLAFESEMTAAQDLYHKGQLSQAFKHLERAHVLGQRCVLPHVRSHWLMLKIGLKRHSPAEVWGQAVRIILGALGSMVGIVPDGNTGGTDINMFARRPIDPDIASILDK